MYKTEIKNCFGAPPDPAPITVILSNKIKSFEVVKVERISSVICNLFWVKPVLEPKPPSNFGSFKKIRLYIDPKYTTTQISFSFYLKVKNMKKGRLKHKI